MKTIRLLSLDVVAGAIASACLAFEFFGLHVDVLYLSCLGLSVFIIYLLDHLSDGWRLSKSDNSDRYSFYFLNNKKIVVTLILSGITLLVQILFLPKSILLFGIVTGLFVLAYLVMNMLQSRYNFVAIPRELLISLLYTAAIWGGAIILRNKETNAFQILYIFSFFSLVLINVLSFSYYGYEEDKTDNIKTLAVILGKKTSAAISIFFIATSTASLFYLQSFSNLYYPYILVQETMLIGLCATMVFLKFMKRNEHYAYVSDALFILPSLSLLFY